MDRRLFLTLAGASLLRASEGSAAPARLDASVERLADSRVQVGWSPITTPVSILVSDTPDTPRDRLRRVEGQARSGHVEVAAPRTPRPYFLLRAADGEQTRVAERLLPLRGGRNFRDLGGYRTTDGRQVRWGRLYRSGVMTGFEPDDMAYLQSLGVAVICDLRSPQERAREPSPFLKGGGGPAVISYEYPMASTAERMAGAKTRADAVQAFAESYVHYLDMLGPNYTDMFARLVRGEAPLAVNCTAGKDRSGVASALILSVLGVPRQTVIADYALTETYTPPSFYLKQASEPSKPGAISSEQAKSLSRLPPEVLQVLMGSDPDVMREALGEIDRRYGGPVALAKARFGLTDGSIAQLRQSYLI
ncbi:tyrosine-protein phosphatase [Phenylobacterium sp.]|uniref:tyrosine-protein phosphatase n=1 Tax=Phenylobacterium sp. TaxID=1871053 RepID=UPI002F42353C